MAAFRAAIDAGAGIECDLRLTRDGFPIIFHDSSLERMCGVQAETESVSAAALMALPIAGTGEHIPWLGQLLDLAGEKTPLLLELKAQDGWPPRPVDLLCRAVAQTLVGHSGPVGVMSFDPRVPAWFARCATDIPRGLVIGDDVPRWRRTLSLAMARPDFVAVETSAAVKPWVARERSRRPVASWTVRTSDQRAALSNRVDALIWEGDGRP
ncbi:glycerophosphodiester phosphodiesterase family protein [Sphingomonas humi]|uniref:Glycerophosphodiester phosphodiesterase family protein n=1 Tax=Sphingomonas humi TaxID=335630 RepID=A0ABP7RLS2_9SPHN